jgi:hypothetical protein
MVCSCVCCVSLQASPVFYSTMMPSTDSQQHHHQGGAVDRSRIVRGLGPVPLGKPGKVGRLA